MRLTKAFPVALDIMISPATVLTVFESRGTELGEIKIQKEEYWKTLVILV